MELPGLLYADNLVLCGELEKEPRGDDGTFVEVCRRSLKVNVGKNEKMVMNVE